MIVFYRTLINIILLISPLIILTRIIKKKEHPARFKEKFCFFSKKKIKKNLIWFHGASVGEILSVIPLIEKFEKDKNIHQILITSNTLSSSKIINNLRLKKTIHQFFPIDNGYFSKKFLAYWKPTIAIFIDSEIWPNMILNIKKKKIPLILLNGRINKKSFHKWKKINQTAQLLFSKFDICYPSSKESNIHLRSLGIKKTKYTGNLKFALTPDLADAKKYDELKVLTGNRKIFLAASTHPGEEEIISRVTLKLKKTCKELLTVVVPRHPTRNNIINKNIIKNTAIRSMGNKVKRNTHIYLADTIGELNLFYKLADIIFIGGSLVMHGGQNPIEAAYHGKKVYHGKHVENFSDVYLTLDQMKLSQVVNNERQLEHFIHEEYKLLDKAVRKVDISSLQKEGEETVKKVLKEIYQYL